MSLIAAAPPTQAQQLSSTPQAQSQQQQPQPQQVQQQQQQMPTTAVVAASRKHVELSLELKRKLIQEHEHGVPFTLLGKKYHIATSTAANIWRKKDFFLRSRMSGSRKRCNDRSKYKIVNQVTALFVKSMLERNHKIDGEVIKRFARTAAAQCNFKDFHGSNGWLDSFKKRENVCWVRRRGERNAAASSFAGASGGANSLGASISQLQQSSIRRSDSPNLSTAAAAAAVAATANRQHEHHHQQQAAAANSQQQQSDSAHSRCQSPQSAHSCNWMDDEVSCARCTVAAAAAAIAALNSSDSIHERDHEIEDWFHGIPFLCQFFEEYQSMHQQQVDQQQHHQAAASNSNNFISTNNAGQFQQHHRTIKASLATVTSSNPISSCASSSSSSSLSISIQQTMTNDSGAPTSAANHISSMPMEPFSGSSTSSSSCNDDNNNTSSSNQLQRTISTDMIDALQMKTLDHQPHQQQHHHQQQPAELQSHYGAGEQQVGGYQQCPATDYPMATASSGEMLDVKVSNLNPNNLGSCDQLMEINFTDDQQQQQASALSSRNNSSNFIELIDSDRCSCDEGQQCPGPMSGQCLHQCQTTNGPSSAGANSNAALQCNGQQQQQQQQQGAAMNNCDYNSDDQEFYLSAGVHYTMAPDARSDELIYHDEVSDHNDCCSDHYEAQPTGAGGAHELANGGYGSSGGPVNAPAPSMQPNGNATAGQLNEGCSMTLSRAGSSACYLDEYEYENISTIRHYPVPMSSMPTTSSASSAFSVARQEQQQQMGTSDSNSDLAYNNNSANAQQTLMDESGQEMAVGQHQQASPGNFLHSSANTNSSAASSSSTTPPANGAQQVIEHSGNMIGQSSSSSSIYQDHQQQQQQQPMAMNGGLDYGSLNEHEQTIEHADHEEHNLLHNALMRSPEKLKLIDSIITLLNYASSYNQKMLSPLLEIKRCIERDLEVVLSDTSSSHQQCCSTSARK